MDDFSNFGPVNDVTALNELSKPEGPGVVGALGAALRTETTVGSIVSREKPEMASLRNGIDAVDEDFVFSQPHKYHAYASEFAGKSEAGAEALMRNIDGQLADKEKLDRAGALGAFAATGIVQLADPVNYLPIAGATFKGASLGQKVTRGAKAGLIGSAAQEPILFGTQETRTLGESIANVGASVVFGAALGGLTHAFDRSTFDLIKQSEVGPVMPTQAQAEVRDLSAAAARQVTEEDLEITSKAQRGLIAATPDILSPALALTKSQSPLARELGLGLSENFLQVSGVESGAIGQAVETAIKISAEPLEIAKERGLRTQFDAYVDEIGGPSRVRVFERAKVQREFGERVGQAMRRGDVDGESQAVTRAAQEMRAKVLDPILRQAQAAGLLPPNMTSRTAVSYFRRAYNQAKLSANQGEFEGILTQHFAAGIRNEGLRNQDIAQLKLSDAEARLQTATEVEGQGPTTAQTDDTQAEVARLSREANKLPKFPVGSALKALGGIDPDGEAARELVALGFNNKTLPGLFKRGGLRDIDNLDPDGFGRSDLVRTDGYYLDRQDLIDALQDELNRAPRRSDSEDFILREIDEAERFLSSVTGASRGAGRKELDALEAEVAELRKNAKVAGDELAELSPQEQDFYAKEAARGVWHTLTGRDGGFEDAIVAQVQGPLKGRTLMIPDEAISEFLDDDAFSVLGNYIRTMTAEIELAKKYGRADLRDQIKQVQEEYSGLKDGKTEKEAIALDKERDATISRIEAIRDRARGTYLAKDNSTPFAAAARASNSFNFVRMLGDVTLSSLPDAFRVAQVHGLQNLLGPKGLSIIGKSIKSMRGSEAEKFLSQEPELAGIAEVLLNARVQGMADLHDPYAATGPIESTMRTMANVGSRASGITHWNQFWKQVAWQHGVERMKRVGAAGFENASKKDRKWLNSLKVSRGDMDRIARQIKEHSAEHGALTDARSGSWSDDYALQVFRGALRADADSVVVTPGIGDKPLFADKPLGSLAFQFKSFFAATHTRALARGLGEDQTDFLTGSGMMIGMGAAVYYLKSLSGNYEVSDNPGVWLAEGIDRSGVMAMAMEVNNTLEPSLNRIGAGGVYTGLSAMLGDSSELSSRYRFRSDPISAILGPTAGTVRDGLKVVEDLAKQAGTGEGVTEGTAGAAARMLPFANHPGVKQWMRYYAIPAAKDAAG